MRAAARRLGRPAPSAQTPVVSYVMLRACPWQTPTLTNAWLGYGAPYYDPAYCKDAGGWVHLRGMAKSGTLGTVAFVLPAGFRPAAQLQFPAIGGGALANLVVGNTGNVVLNGTANASYTLDGITFRAEQ
jgi:hypothetical protein